MSFGFDCNNSADAFRSLKGLVNHNQGVWKSRKQREFLLNGSSSPLNALKASSTPEEQAVGARRVCVNAHVQFGRRYSPVTWVFVIDDIGVVQMIRIRRSGNEVEWTRPEGVDSSHLDQPTPEEEAAHREAFNEVFTARHVGTLGQREELELTLTGVFHKDTYSLNFLKDRRGNLFMYAGKVLGQRGSQVRVRATIHAHSTDRKGAALNIIKRPYSIKAGA